MNWDEERFNNYICESNSFKEHITKIANIVKGIEMEYPSEDNSNSIDYYYGRDNFTINCEWEYRDEDNKTISVSEGDWDDYSNDYRIVVFPEYYLFIENFAEEERKKVIEKSGRFQLKRDKIQKEKIRQEEEQEYEDYLKLAKKFEGRKETI